MIWHILRYWITFLIPTFYKKIQAKNLHLIRQPGPVIISMNHPNAFTDPILLTYLVYPQRLRFLARGDAFKPGLITRFLESLGIIPIFRIQDAGKEGLKKNDESYRRVNHFLKKNEKIIVFAEGLCIQERRLRPLKKGVARMVFGAYEALKDDRLIVLPVCVNYSQPDQFRSTAFYNIGEPIKVKDYIPEYTANPARTHKKFLADLESKMKQLLTHIEDPANDNAVYMLEELCKNDLLKKRHLKSSSLLNDFIVLTELTEKINLAAKVKPQLLNEFKESGNKYFARLRKHRLGDHLIQASGHYSIFYVIFRMLSVMLLLPVYIIGFGGNYVPLKLAHILTTRIAPTREFYSSFALGTGMIFFLLNYILIFILAYIVLQSDFLSFICCLIVGISGGISLFIHPFMVNTVNIVKLYINRRLARQLRDEREHIMSVINNF
jgi:glycerol-3-phosphate O-acyltransferase / dihydroxyacetone phosphate acyltransferase